MPEKELIEWYVEELNKGVSKIELIQALYEEGYSKEERDELISTVEASLALKRKSSREWKDAPESGPQLEDLSTVEKITPWEKHAERKEPAIRPPIQKKQPKGSKTDALTTGTKRIKAFVKRHAPISKPPKRVTLQEFVNKESHLIWRLIFALLLCVLGVIGIVLVLVFWLSGFHG